MIFMTERFYLNVSRGLAVGALSFHNTVKARSFILIFCPGTL
jgi:hypothetical protein